MFCVYIHTFDAEGSVFPSVCFVTSIDVQRSCRGFHMGLSFLGLLGLSDTFGILQIVVFLAAYSNRLFCLVL